MVQPSRASNSYIRTLNNVGSSCGLGGVFHAGVELFDLEWSFGYCPAERGTGVYCCKPKSNPQCECPSRCLPGHRQLQSEACAPADQYRETVTLGISPLSKQQVGSTAAHVSGPGWLITAALLQVQRVIAELQQAWQGKDYELLTRNCTLNPQLCVQAVSSPPDSPLYARAGLHFCNALCAKLEVPEIPAHLNRLAYGADTVVTFANNAVEQVRGPKQPGTGQLCLCMCTCLASTQPALAWQAQRGPSGCLAAALAVSCHHKQAVQQEGETALCPDVRSQTPN